jgi:hypothetical protein
LGELGFEHFLPFLFLDGVFFELLDLGLFFLAFFFEHLLDVFALLLVAG